ncbi:MAG: hypoxanthine phosphoribosyltransferase [Actinobacteria bacterium]|nr:hypoxanthine phosphoribosyltransferase [Actinomycetota bacterium]
MINFKSPNEYESGDILIPNSVIKERIREIAEKVREDFKNKDLLIVGVLKGAFKLVSDFTQELHELGFHHLHISFIALKSYPTGTVAQREAKLTKDLDVDPSGRDVLIVDDILDTGKSLSLITDIIRKKGAKSIKSFVLLDKPERREVNFTADYIGIKIPNIWVQGYGMDTEETGRAEPNIIVGPFKY